MEVCDWSSANWRPRSGIEKNCFSSRFLTELTLQNTFISRYGRHQRRSGRVSFTFRDFWCRPLDKDILCIVYVRNIVILVHFLVFLLFSFFWEFSRNDSNELKKFQGAISHHSTREISHHFAWLHCKFPALKFFRCQWLKSNRLLLVDGLDGWLKFLWFSVWPRSHLCTPQIRICLHEHLRLIMDRPKE